VKTLVGLALGTLLSLGTMSAASAASNVAPKDVAEQVIEEIIVTAKRLAPEVIDEIIVTAKRPGKGDQARTPPAMPIVSPRLEFAVAAPPVVRL
jgi:hypothetical protein